MSEKEITTSEITEAQENFLADLFVECSFTRKQRNAWMTARFVRPIGAVDELTKSEASTAINALMRMKEGRR